MWQPKDVLAFSNDKLQSYETDNKGVLRYYIFLVFFCCLFYASSQLCNGGNSFFGISDTVQIESNTSVFCTSLSLEKKPGLEKMLLWFSPWYSKTLWAASRGEATAFTQSIPSSA